MAKRHFIGSLLIALGCTISASASDYGDIKLYSTNSSFAEVRANVEDAIVNRGYVVDYHGFIGKMLNRTGQDVGSSKATYKEAEFFQFCSAVLTRKMTEADPRNIGYCPYVVTVYELASDPGRVYVGYRLPALSGSEESKRTLGAIGELLDKISREAVQ